MRRRQRRGAHAVDDAVEREAELERLVQRHLEHARDDLGAAGETLRRREDDRQPFAVDAAVVGDLVDDRRRRRAGAFQDQRRAVGLVGVAELLEQRLAARQRARRARSRARRRRPCPRRARASSPHTGWRGRRSPDWPSASPASTASAASAARQRDRPRRARPCRWRRCAGRPRCCPDAGCRRRCRSRRTRRAPTPILSSAASASRRSTRAAARAFTLIAGRALMTSSRASDREPLREPLRAARPRGPSRPPPSRPPP